MARFADQPVVEVSADIAAPPAAVWRLVTDINLPARFQDEFQEAWWVGAGGPGPGAEFRGRQQRGDREWETMSYVTEFEEGRAFGWAVSDRDNPGATWTFLLTPADGGTTLTFRRVLGPGPSGITAIIAKHPDREEEIIASRNETHRRNMQAVVEGVKALAETLSG